MRDEPRADAKAGLEALQAAGIETVMLTGDNRQTAEAIGASLGITVRAELLPEDKQRIVREMQAGGRKVAKVGDGINDAPALAAADVGIAMGGGTDVALETADAAVLHGRVMDLARMVELSRRHDGQHPSERRSSPWASRPCSWSRPCSGSPGSGRPSSPTRAQPSWSPRTPCACCRFEGDEGAFDLLAPLVTRGNRRFVSATWKGER